MVDFIPHLVKECRDETPIPPCDRPDDKKNDEIYEQVDHFTFRLDPPQIVPEDPDPVRDSPVQSCEP